MRVSDKMVMDQSEMGLNHTRRKMLDAQTKAATQKRVNKPSDDPVSASQVLASRSEISGNTQYQKNIDIAKSFLNFTDQALGELTNLLVRAKELAVGQANDASANAETRRTVASEIKQLYWQAVQVGNRKLGDRYIFGGTRTTTAPFSPVGQYQGDKGDIRIQTNKDAFIAVNLPGGQIFHGEDLGSDGVSRARGRVPRTVNELDRLMDQEKKAKETKASPQRPSRGLASVGGKQQPAATSFETSGVNLFRILKDLEIGLKTNSKESIRQSLDVLDEAVSQVILSRAEVGSRVMTLDSISEGLQKAKVDASTTMSRLEDADVFKLVSDINQAETALKSTLNMSGKMIQPSLLDFLR